MNLIIAMLITVGQSCTEQVTLTGTLGLFGAEPFVKTALVTHDDRRIFLDTDKEVLKKIRSGNRGEITIRGELYEGEWYGRPHLYIRVKEWKWEEAGE